MYDASTSRERAERASGECEPSLNRRHAGQKVGWRAKRPDGAWEMRRTRPESGAVAAPPPGERRRAGQRWTGGSGGLPRSTACWACRAARVGAQGRLERRRRPTRAAGGTGGAAARWREICRTAGRAAHWCSGVRADEGDGVGQRRAEAPASEVAPTAPSGRGSIGGRCQTDAASRGGAMRWLEAAHVCNTWLCRKIALKNY